MKKRRGILLCCWMIVVFSVLASAECVTWYSLCMSPVVGFASGEAPNAAASLNKFQQPIFPLSGNRYNRPTETRGTGEPTASVILYSQTDSTISYAFPSQQFEVARSNLINQGADDFVVPAADGAWILRRIIVPGIYSEGGGRTSKVNVYIYGDKFGVPEEEVYKVVGVPPLLDVLGSLTIDLPSPIELSPGTYWLSVQVDMDSSVAGQWFWASRTIQTNNPYMWRNPEDGFDTGCIDWAAGATECGVGTESETDASFTLYGNTLKPHIDPQHAPSFSDSGQRLGDSSSNDIALGDLDGDGDIDAVFGNLGQDTLWRNENGIFKFAYSLPDINTVAIALGDIDNDGDFDIITSNQGGDAPEANFSGHKLWQNEGDFNFVESDIFSGRGNSKTILLADIDNDLDLDALLSMNGFFEIWKNDGSGSYEAFSSFGDSLGTDTDMDIGDLDNDGDLDIFVAHDEGLLFDESCACHPGGENRVWLNRGGLQKGELGTFVESESFESNRSTSVKLADLDSDGDLDAVVGNRSDGNSIYFNNGLGIFSRIVNFGNEWTKDVDAADLDGDADLDIILGNVSSISYVLNDGFGAFTYPTYLGEKGPERIALGDIESDGDLDILAAHGLILPPNRVWLNDGGGLLSLPHSIGSINSESLSVALGDLDGDADLDVLTGNVTGQPNVVFQNNGHGIFAQVGAFGEILPTFGIALGDLDYDHDLDVVTSHDGRNTVWENQGQWSLMNLLVWATQGV